MHGAQKILKYSSPELLGGSFVGPGLGLASSWLSVSAARGLWEQSDLDQAVFGAGFVTNTHIPGRFHPQQAVRAAELPQGSLCANPAAPSCPGSCERNCPSPPGPPVAAAPGVPRGIRGHQLWAKPSCGTAGVTLNCVRGRKGDKNILGQSLKLLLLRLSVVFTSGPLMFQLGWCPIF